MAVADMLLENAEQGLPHAGALAKQETGALKGQFLQIDKTFRVYLDGTNVSNYCAI
jgi:hypothetical protein